MKLEATTLIDSRKVAQKLLELLNKHNFNTIAFTGDLGTGKTTVTQLIGKELGIELPIQSPTFVLMREYDIHKPSQSFSKLIHIDAYRLESHDTDIFDFEELFSAKTNLVIIEWADNIKIALPSRYLAVDIKQEGKNRIFTIEAVNKIKR